MSRPFDDTHEWLALLAQRAGGSFNGRDALIPGPGHSREDRSLSVSIGRGGQVIFHSFADDDDFVVRDYLRSLGVDVSARGTTRAPSAQERSRPKSEGVNARLAGLWRRSSDVAGTLAARYLAERGIKPPYPKSLRFLLRCADGPFLRPALIAARTLIATPERVTSVQRTFLLKDGADKAHGQSAKKTLGACRGGGVVLGVIEDVTLIAEGIETALSASAIFDLPAVATLGVAHTRAIIVPARIKRIVIAADNDAPGLQAAEALAARLRAQRCIVRTERPPAGVKDFNDLLSGKGSDR